MRCRQEHFNCKVQDFTDRGNFYEYTERSTKTRTGDTDNPKARRKCSNKIFHEKGGERDPYLALKKYLSHRPEGIGEFLFPAHREPQRGHLIKEASTEERRTGEHHEKNGREGRNPKGGELYHLVGSKNSYSKSSRSFRSTCNLRAHWARLPRSIHSYSQNAVQTTQKEMFD